MGSLLSEVSDEVGYENVRLGGVAHKLVHDLKSIGFEADMRETVLDIYKRGTPTAYDRILATQFGVKSIRNGVE